MKLPEAIQRQVDEAEALERQLYQQQESPAEQVVEEEMVAQEEPPANAPEHVEPEPQNVEPVVEHRREDDAAYWKQRFNTVQGMLNSQSAQFTEQLRASNNQVQALANELAELREQRTQQTQTVNDNDAETFGEDLVTAIDRRAEQKASQLVANELGPLRAYIQQLESRLGEVNQSVAETAQDRFYANLERLVPDYQAVNGDQNFLNWLEEVDSVYGVSRQLALDNAANALDAQRVAAVFNAYKALTGKQADDTRRKQVRQELERQTAPSPVQGSAQSAPAGKIYTAAEYEAALDPRNIKLMGREKADALAADAEAAYYEGRVRFE